MRTNTSTTSTTTLFIAYKLEKTLITTKTLQTCGGRLLTELESIDDPDKYIQAYVNAADDIALRAGRLTTIMTANNDPTGVRYARVPVGPTCEFCIMLASRGFVYHTHKNPQDKDSTPTTPTIIA